jgi:hypothetical protein
MMVEMGIDKILFESCDTLMNDIQTDSDILSNIDELNRINGNFDSIIVKDLLIEFFDYGLFESMSVTKKYIKYKDEQSDYYLYYRLYICFVINTEYSEKYIKLREVFINEYKEVKKIIEEYYGHDMSSRDIDNNDINSLDSDQFRYRNIYIDISSKSLKII